MLNTEWGLMVWTLITFGIALFVLWKFAFAMGPQANFQRTNRAMPNVMGVQTMRPHSVFSMAFSDLPCGRSRRSRHEDQDEGDDEGVQRHGLGHADTDEHVGAHFVRYIRLQGDALESLADQHAQAQGRADRPHAHRNARGQQLGGCSIHSVSSLIVHASYASETVLTQEH